jgi:ubiquinone biosynthesis monooxygenase Coq7
MAETADTRLPVSEADFAAAQRELELIKLHDPWLMAELRSDHAGETGAVWIYKGAYQAMQLRPLPKAVGEFVSHHLETEKGHLAYFDTLLSHRQQSRLTSLWVVAGFGLGFIPTLLGPKALYATIHAVETYVEKHYNNHIHRLEARGTSNPYPKLTMALKQFCSDEVEHAVDAGDRYGFRKLEAELKEPSLARAWSWVVAQGSAAAVEVAKRV